MDTHMIKCSVCDCDNIYEETIVSFVYEDGRKVKYEWTRYTCLNLDCGHYWPEDLV
jgi:hypothetical protein